jgi:beta-glucosidase
LKNPLKKLVAILFISVVSAMPTGPTASRRPEPKINLPLLTESRIFGVRMPASDGLDHPFPKGFMWGVATSAFQNEGGGGKTDWDAWFAEKSVRPGFVGFTEADILLAREYGVQYIRNSIEWARIEPEEGVWDEQELDRAFRMAKFAEKNGVHMMINLNHFALPQWAAAKGGWENDDLPALFAVYAEKVGKKFKPLGIEYWMTFNEPLVLVANGYMNAAFPPLRKGDSHGAMLARRNIIRAHRAAYDALHRICDTRRKKIKVGIALPADYYMPARAQNEDDRKVTAALEFAMDIDFADAVEDRLDYLGLNYYSGWLIKFNPWGSFFGVSVEYVNADRRDDNIYPEGLYWTVKEFSRYRKPIIVTENGLDDGTDSKRPVFIASHLLWLQKAAAEAGKDAPVIGYFYWTLIDNFEWVNNDCVTAHFGLFSVDPRTKERTPRPSAALFRDISRANSLTQDMIANTK